LYVAPLLPGEPLAQPERVRLANRLAAVVLAAAQALPADAARLLYTQALVVEPDSEPLRQALRAL
jgi:hypothetical protein